MLDKASKRKRENNLRHHATLVVCGLGMADDASSISCDSQWAQSSSGDIIVAMLKRISGWLHEGDGAADASIDRPACADGQPLASTNTLLAALLGGLTVHMCVTRLG